LLLLGLVVVSCSADFLFGSEEYYRSSFASFMSKYDKKYPSDELVYRFKVFKANLDFVATHNKKNLSYTLGMNRFGDMPFAEFHAKYTGLNYVQRDFIRSRNHVHEENVNNPASVDWRSKNAVTPVKDQGQCGSCWAFSATGSMEGSYAIAKGSLLSLAEQQLVDCSGSFGNQGCNGGLMDYAFEYVIKNGITTEDKYPYKAVDQRCKSPLPPAAIHITSYVDVQSNSDPALETAVAKGPVSVAIEADQPAFQFYKSGVFSDPSCGTMLDHGVTAVGYDVDSKKTKYWIVKNSWGADWGSNGYIMMLRKTGAGQCGINMENSYAVV